jgi:hypothetical protein
VTGEIRGEQMTSRGFGHQQAPRDPVLPAVGVPAWAGEPPRPTADPLDPTAMLRRPGPGTAVPPAAPFPAPATAPAVPAGPPGAWGPAAVPATRAHRNRAVAAEPAGPGRRLVVGAMAGALVSGALTGLVVGVLDPPSPPKPTVQLAAGASAGAPATTRAPAVPAPRTSAIPRASLELRTEQLAQVTPPFDRIEHPAAVPGLRFVRVEDVWRGQEGRIMLRVTPLLPNGRERSGAQQFEVRLSGEVMIFGEFYIGDHTNVQPRRFGPDETHDLLRGALAFGKHPTVWIMRKFVIDGSVVYLQEQAPPEDQR